MRDSPISTLEGREVTRPAFSNIKASLRDLFGDPFNSTKVIHCAAVAEATVLLVMF